MEKIYYSISEVADELQVNQSVLRFWEKEFEEVNPKRNTKGTRFYTKEDIEMLKNIQFLLKEQKLTIEGAKQSLSKKNLSEIVKKRKLISKLEAIRSELIAIRREVNYVDPIDKDTIID